MKSARTAFILFTLLIIVYETKSFEIIVCHDNSSNFEMSNNKARVVDVTVGSAVHIWCHYCNSKEDYYPKLWFYKHRGKKLKSNEEIHIIDDISDTISISLSHILNINYFNSKDSGIYTCKSCKNKNGHNFTYVLDGIIYVGAKPKVGSTPQWQEYKHIYIDSMNKKFKLSADEPYKSLKHNYNITLHIYTIWDNWSECKPLEGHQKGKRKRLGRCRIGPVVNNSTKIDQNKNSLSDIMSYLYDGYDIPCRSLKLNEYLPDISKIVRNIPEFEAEETCTVFTDAKNYKLYTKKSKLKSIQEVMENSHVTLMCNEVMPNSDLKWFKDKKLLKSLYGNILSRKEVESHLTIDANNSLHILHISKNEEGNYTCLMNGKRIKQYEVKVVSKSKILNQEFIRYSIYLGFVLSLTMTCYCAGVCVAWHRRASFADPLNLYKKKPYNLLNCELEQLLD